MDSGVQVGFSLKSVTAKEVMDFSRNLKSNPDSSIELFAGLLAKTVVFAPIEGDLKNPETYLNLPFWAEDGGISFNELVQALNDALEKVQSSTRKQ